MKLKFSKLSGAGNDFILVEKRALGRLSGPAAAKKLCARRFSIGADGLLIVEKRGLRLAYFNSDGSKAFCGNGARSAAWWMHSQGWAGKKFKLATTAGLLDVSILGKERAKLSMPAAKGLRQNLKLSALGRRWSVDYITVGVPHAVVEIPASQLDDFPVNTVGKALRSHRAFGKAGANVNFVAPGVVLKVRTFERGVEGETLACGSGVVASAICASHWDKKRAPIRLRAKSGAVLSVDFKRTGKNFSALSLEGPARVIYTGETVL